MAKRQSVNFPGFSHQNPIPNASRIGNIMMTSVISGVDPGTRNLPPELAKQVTNLFTHVRAALEAAGGTPDDIIKMTFWMKEPASGRATGERARRTSRARVAGRTRRRRSGARPVVLLLRHP